MVSVPRIDALFVRVGVADTIRCCGISAMKKKRWRAAVGAMSANNSQRDKRFPIKRVTKRSHFWFAKHFRASREFTDASDSAQRFALLRGQDDPRLRSAGLENTTTWGILAERSESWLTKLLRRCVTAGWVDFWGGDRPVVILTETGSSVMRGDRKALILLPPDGGGIKAERKAERPRLRRSTEGRQRNIYR